MASLAYGLKCWILHQHLCGTRPERAPLRKPLLRTRISREGLRVRGIAIGRHYTNIVYSRSIALLCRWHADRARNRALAPMRRACQIAKGEERMASVDSVIQQDFFRIDFFPPRSAREKSRFLSLLPRRKLRQKVLPLKEEKDGEEEAERPYRYENVRSRVIKFLRLPHSLSASQPPSIRYILRPRSFHLFTGQTHFRRWVINGARARLIKFLRVSRFTLKSLGRAVLFIVAARAFTSAPRESPRTDTADIDSIRACARFAVNVF